MRYRQTQVSVVLLSWMRPENILKIVDALDHYDTVLEILIWNNNAAYRDRLVPTRQSKARIVDARENWGFYPRLAMAALAAAPVVMILDDDLIIRNETIEFLIEKVREKPTSLHGIAGRRPSDDHYKPLDIFGEVEMLIGRCILGRRELFVRAIEFTYLLEEVQQQMSPYGNGEDLILSYSTLYHFGKMNYAYKVPRKEFSAPHAVSRRPGHYAHRTKIMNRCRELVATLASNR